LVKKYIYHDITKKYNNNLITPKKPTTTWQGHGRAKGPISRSTDSLSQTQVDRARKGFLEDLVGGGH
jgi:hypothetical protein